MRRKQNTKKRAKIEMEPALKKWHATFREKLIRVNRDDKYDEKWGRFPPPQRYNVDQTPLPFVISRNKTYHHYDEGVDQHKEKVWISQPGSGLEKRQCTLQVCLRASGEQPRLAVIFRGKGKVSADEKMAWSPDIDVYFQANAWADTEFSIEWVEKTLAPMVKDESHYVLLCDNLTAQTSEAFKEAVAKTGGLVWYGLPNATDLWQVVDSGPAQLLKTFIGQSQRKWLEDDTNSDKWYGQESFSAKERRILITHWAAEAWRKLTSPEYEEFLKKSWLRTGCLMTADGSEDYLIKPEGLLGYQVPPPCLTDPSMVIPESPSVEGTDAADEEEDEDTFDEHALAADESASDELPEDKIEDRDFQNGMVGKKIRCYYADGWDTGEIIYFNRVLGRLKVMFQEDTDLIPPSAIDGVEIQLLS